MDLGDPFQLVRSYRPLEVLLEVGVIWVCVYIAFRFLRGTRGAGVIKGFAILMVLITLLTRVLGHNSDTFARLNFIYERLLGLLAIMLIVVFQPELRQALIRLSTPRHFRAPQSQAKVVTAVAEATQFLSKNNFGAIIAIERTVRLGGLIETGQAIDAEVSARLLETLFWPSSPLHDLGVVIRGDRIVAAGVQFPLTEEGTLAANVGSRHRAAVGVTTESDCVVVVVSEETGTISVAEAGRIDFNVPPDALQSNLARRLQTQVSPFVRAGDAAEAGETMISDQRAASETLRSPATGVAAPHQSAA